MNKRDLVRGLKIVESLLSVKFDASVVDAMRTAFGDAAKEDWFAACLAVGKTFRPTAAQPYPLPADFQDAMEKHQTADLDLEAQRAWQRVMQAINDQMDRERLGDMGYYPRGSCLQPLDWAAIGGRPGLHALYEAGPEQYSYWRHRFVQAYRDLGGRVRRGELAESELPGLPSPRDTKPRLRQPEPKALGQVLEGGSAE